MTNPYRNRPQGIDAFLDRIRALEKAVEAIRSSAGLVSAVIGRGGLTIKDGGTVNAVGGWIGSLDPVTRAQSIFHNSILYLYPDVDDATALPAKVQVDPGNQYQYRALRLYPPVTQGQDVGANTITIIGRGGSTQARVVTYGDYIDFITVDGVRIYGSPTTSAGANMCLDGATVKRSTSSERYKQDIEDAEIDATDVLAIRPRTWRDRVEVADAPDTTTRYVGFIAEELDAIPSMRQFVVYDDEGRPDAISYDRLAAALAVVAQKQADDIATINRRLDALENGRA